MRNDMTQARLHIEDDPESGEPLEGSGFENETPEDLEAQPEVVEADEEAPRG